MIFCIKFYCHREAVAISLLSGLPRPEYWPRNDKQYIILSCPRQNSCSAVPPLFLPAASRRPLEGPKNTAFDTWKFYRTDGLRPKKFSLWKKSTTSKSRASICLYGGTKPTGSYSANQLACLKKYSISPYSF